jgi:hypothetical protein
VRRFRAAAGTLLFLVVAPGVVAGLVPWLLTGSQTKPLRPPQHDPGAADERLGYVPGRIVEDAGATLQNISAVTADDLSRPSRSSEPNEHLGTGWNRLTTGDEVDDGRIRARTSAIAARGAR